MEIKMLPGEYWWGGAVDWGKEMPLCGSSDFCADLSGGEKDQCSPVFLSSKGRYIVCEKPPKVEFKKGTIKIDEGCAPRLFETGGGLKEAHLALSKKHFKNDGRIPDESFFEIPQYNTWIELMYNQNQEDILSYANEIVKNGMRPGILMIDEGWSEDYGVYDFYPGRFQNPKEMLRKLHALGFKVMLWVTPNISPDSNAFRYLRDTDYLVKDKDGKIAIREWWNGYSCVLDLSNPQARKYLEEKLCALMRKYGIDGFKFDAGDTYMYCDCDKSFKPGGAVQSTKQYDLFAADYKFNELRAVWDMGGEPIVCRLQDKKHSWNDTGLDCIIPNMIMQGLLGYYYGCPDMIGGGAYGSFLEKGFKLDEELYIRWLEASLLCPMLQFSIAPWRVLKKENYDIVKKYIAFRERFTPYIIQLAKEAALGKGPVLRPMAYEYPQGGYEECKDMYMLGDRYIVMPIVKKGENECTANLPPGKWKCTDGKIYENSARLCQKPGGLMILEKA